MDAPPPPYTNSNSNNGCNRINSLSSRHSISHQPNRQSSNDRGLGGLMVGLGAAAMLNNAMNNPSAQTNQYHGNGNGREDPLTTLGRFDTILLIDDSASMAMSDLWKEAANAVSGLAETLVRYDSGVLVTLI